MNTADYQTLALRQDGAVLTVALDRPDVMNAANAQLEIELCRFFTEVSHDANTRVVIVTGQGKAFSAGGDFAYIPEMMDHPARFPATKPSPTRLSFSMLDLRTPENG